MAKRRHDPAKERWWREALAAWRSSQLSVRAFCARRGLSEPSFYQWRRELARRDRAATKDTARTARAARAVNGAAPTFVPVEVMAEAPGTTAAIEIVLASGVAVRVRPGFDRQTLAQVMALLTAGAAEGSEAKAGGASC